MKSKNQIRRERKKQRRGDSDQSQATGRVTGDAEATRESSGGLSVQTPAGAEGVVVDKPPRSTTVLARKYDWLNPDDPLYEMYQQVSSRFKRGREPEGAEDPEEPIEEAREENESTPVNETSQPSKKQLRRSTKPALVELKKETQRPELVEWYDADAPYPHFLVKLKTLPNVVQVPGNWRHRSEVTQFGPKPKYEPPKNISELNIAEARKGTRLDLDYEQMHAAFFSPESGPPRSNLLPYGEIVDLKLRRIFKPATKKSPSLAISTKPTQISQRLREALGIREGEELPWEKTVKQLGLAPGYQSSNQPSYERWGSYD